MKFDCPYCMGECSIETPHACPEKQKPNMKAHGVTDAHPTQEKINHPAHYGGDTVYEAIKVIEAWGLDFCLGNTVKYIARAGKKDPDKELEDLKKAKWYLTPSNEATSTAST